MMSLLKNIHLDIEAPGPQHHVSLVKGDYQYWHYCCDGCDDRGWGCGYRTLQTLCSWVRLQHKHQYSMTEQPSNLECDVGHTPLPHVTLPLTDRNKSENSDICVIAAGDSSSGGDTITVIDEALDIKCDSHVIASGGNSGGVKRSGGAITAMAGDGRHGIDESADITVVFSGTVATSANNISNSYDTRISHGDLKDSLLGFGDISVADSSDCRDRDAGKIPVPALETDSTKHQSHAHIPSQMVRDVPSILKIQEALVKMGDKPGKFAGSRQWIGSYEVCLCLDFFYNVPCKIVHIKQGADLKQHLSLLQVHFSTLGSPVMMGGDSDASSKGIMGVCTNPAALLVVDPHYSGNTKTVASLQAAGWVKWVLLEDFHQTSFYNLCLPQLAARLPG